jgi:hypothetical protein
VYLRGFADDGWLTIRTRSGIERTVHLTDVTVRKNFYNVRTSKGVETSAVETWLARSVESPIGPVFDRLRDGDAVREADRPALVRFVVSQLLRTPTSAAMLEHIDGHIGPLMVVHAVLTKHGLNPNRLPRNHMEWITATATRVWEEHTRSGARRSQLRTIMRKIDELAEQLSAWTWVVLESDAPVLISSDASVATFHNQDEAWAGIIPPGSPVYLPLSPRHLLVGERNSLDSSTRLSPQLAQMVNKVNARQAADTIFKSPTQTWPGDLVLLPEAPPLPKPTMTWRRDPNTAPAFPAEFPTILAPDIRAVLDELEATDFVA